MDADRDPGVDGDAGGETDRAGGDGGSLEFAVLGDPDGGPTLDLDHERFAYAGKFVMANTGKALVRRKGSGAAPGEDGGDGEVLAAAAFDRDRTDRSVVRVRYVTVRRDRRGEGIGARLLASLAGSLLDDASPGESVREVLIAVNNPFAYEAAYKAGFGYTGEETGLAELLCARPGDRSAEPYRRGLSAFLDREDPGEEARTFARDRRASGPPEPVAPLPGR